MVFSGSRLSPGGTQKWLISNAMTLSSARQCWHQPPANKGNYLRQQWRSSDVTSQIGSVDICLLGCLRSGRQSKRFSSTKHAHSTSNDFILQCSHRVLLNISSYYKACTYVLANTTSHYKYQVCTEYFPEIILRTTTFARSTSQYYLVLRRLHAILPSFLPLYYNVCTKYFSVFPRHVCSVELPCLHPKNLMVTAR